MTQEEASKILRDMLPGPIVPPVHPGSQKQEAILTALSALSPVSREQVEKLFSGCINCHDKERLAKHIHCYPSFCPVCGKPLTKEAVQMVIERLEALKDGSTTD